MPRTSAQRYFLTWSQVDSNHFTASTCADFLFQFAPTFCEVVEEQHADQGRHFHAVVCFPNVWQRNTTVFDFHGRSADIKGIRNGGTDLYNRRHYLRKGNRSKEEEHTPAAHKTLECDYDAPVELRGTAPPYELAATKVSWGDLVRDCATEQEFLDGVRTHFAREWVLRHDAIVAYASKWYHRSAPFEPQFTAADFTIPPEVDAWVEECKNQRGRRHPTLQVIGRTKLGKTAAIRHLLAFKGLSHVYLQGMFSIDEYDANADFIVMDDVPFQFIPNRKQWWGCQKDFIATDKYRGKRKIPGGQPLIYLGNGEEEYSAARDKKTGNLVLGLMEMDWYNDNTKTVYILDDMRVMPQQ